VSDTNPTRAAVYTRVSTGRQAEEGYSLDEQERRALEHIERQGWTPAGCFREEGVSGAKARRPELDRLLAGLDAIDVIVVSSLDRLGRSTVHLLALYDQLERAGVRLVSLREAIDTSTPVGRLLRTVLAAVAEFERDLGRERTSAGIGGRARETGKPWGTPAYGYRKTVEGHWEPDPVEAPVLQRIFAMRTELGMAKAAIARQLNRDGVPTRKGARWSATVVSKVLSGREGLGEFRHGGEWHQGRHAALIDEQQWTAAQAIDERGRMYAPGAGGRLPKAHLFVRGMLRCSCGEAMLPRSARDQADHYVCRTHKLDAAACPVPPVRRDVIDAAALRMFEEVALDVEATRLHLTGQLDARAAETAAAAPQRPARWPSSPPRPTGLSATTGAGCCPPSGTCRCAPRSPKSAPRPTPSASGWTPTPKRLQPPGSSSTRSTTRLRGWPSSAPLSRPACARRRRWATSARSARRSPPCAPRCASAGWRTGRSSSTTCPRATTGAASGSASTPRTM
jgi:site-specific DNA recombinase